MKKRHSILALALSFVVFTFLASCATLPSPTKGKAIIEDKGTAEGIKTPQWVQISIVGNPRDLEKIPPYTNSVVVVARSDADDLQRAQALSETMQIQVEVANDIALRVEDALKGVKVPGADAKNFSVYSELLVAKIAEATFADFRKNMDWWVKVQTFKADGKADKQYYSVYQLWLIEKKMLKKQLDLALSKMQASLPNAPENTRAMNLAQKAIDQEFFKDGI